MSYIHKISKTGIPFPVNTSELALLWKQFVNRTCIDINSEITNELQNNLLLQIISEGVKHGIIEGDQLTAYNRYKPESPCLIFDHEARLSDNTAIPLSDDFIQNILNPIQIKFNHEQEMNRRTLADNFVGHEFETIRIAEYIKSYATSIDSEKYKQYSNSGSKSRKVLTIEGGYYAIDDFDSVFIEKGEYASEEAIEIERAEFEKVLHCPFDELPLFMGSGYSTVQYIIRKRFSEGK